MEAILIGATGATGVDLLNTLLQDASYTKVITFTRRPLEITHEKLVSHIIDFDKPAEWLDLVQGDVLFSAMGTSLKQAGSQEAQWKVDHDYQVVFAKLARENGTKKLILVSSMKADADSKYFYLKLKGAVEEEVTELSYPSLTILRPPVLIRKNPKRWAETLSVTLLNILNPFGLLQKWKPMDTKIVAIAMAKAGLDNFSGKRILEGQEIRNF